MSRSKPEESTATQKRKRRARKAGLSYVNDFDSGYSRRKCGREYSYLSTRGKAIQSKRTLKRIEDLVIPPAWEDVWICPKSNGHVQARGVDEAGRTQYVYHEDWHTISSARKFDRMHLFGNLLPRIRRRVRKDLTNKKLTKQRVAAAVVRVIDRAQVRIGNEKYAEENESRGATTLTKKHVDVDGFNVSLDFPGKSGKQQEIEFNDKKVAKVISQCEDISGQYLFGYLDEDGKKQPITSSDVNDYLNDVAKETVSAKDFRTWWGSVVALAELAELADLDGETKTSRKKAVVASVKAAAESLGNTPAVCKSSYIHPGILAAGESGELASLLDKVDDSADAIAELTIAETRFANLLPHLDFS